MCWTPGEGVWTRALVGSLCCVPGQDTLLSQSLSPPRSVEGNLTNCWGGGGGKGGGNLVWTSILSRDSRNSPGWFCFGRHVWENKLARGEKC